MKTVAFQGELGAFSHEAALLACGAEASCVPCADFDALFGVVESGEVDCGIIPVENTLLGSVAGNLDRLCSSHLQAVAEVLVRVRHCLIVADEWDDSTMLESVASHPVALAQCSGFFAAHPGIRQVVSNDTAGSVRALVDGRFGADAAIASRLAADRYGAVVLREGIEDHEANFTRFLMLTREPEILADPAKLSVSFTMPNQAGSLYEALGVFAERNLDLSWIESRPIPGRPWKYRFYVDVCEAPATTQQDAVAHLESLGAEVRVLGRYPEARNPGITTVAQSEAHRLPDRGLQDPC